MLFQFLKLLILSIISIKIKEAVLVVMVFFRTQVHVKNVIGISQEHFVQNVAAQVYATNAFYTLIFRQINHACLVLRTVIPVVLQRFAQAVLVDMFLPHRNAY